MLPFKTDPKRRRSLGWAAPRAKRAGAALGGEGPGRPRAAAGWGGRSAPAAAAEHRAAQPRCAGAGCRGVPRARDAARGGATPGGARPGPRPAPPARRPATQPPGARSAPAAEAPNLGTVRNPPQDGRGREAARVPVRPSIPPPCPPRSRRPRAPLLTGWRSEGSGPGAVTLIPEQRRAEAARGAPSRRGSAAGPGGRRRAG